MSASLNRFIIFSSLYLAYASFKFSSNLQPFALAFNVALPFAKLTHTRSRLEMKTTIHHHRDRHFRPNVCHSLRMSVSSGSSVTSSVEGPTKDQFNKKPKRVVIVGGGIGGLAVSCRIASSLGINSGNAEPYEVIILEKNSEEMVGGRCGSFFRETPHGRFRHERGPSLLLLKEAYLDLFRDCIGDAGIVGHKDNIDSVAEDYGLKMKQCIPAYQVVFDDGDTIQLGFPRGGGVDAVGREANKIGEAEASSRSKMNEFESDGADKWDAYMRATSAFLDCGLPNFIEERLDIFSFPSFLIEALRDSGKAWPLKPHSDVLDAIFTSNKMRALASFQDLYVGLEPYRNNKKFGGGVIRKTAPAVFGLLAALELHPTNNKAGVFAPIGGFQAVSTAFQRLAKDCGVDIRYEKTVTKVTEEGVYVIDMHDGSNTEKQIFLPADLIIVNADLPFATKSLMSDNSISPKLHSISKDTNANKVSLNSVHYDWDDKFDYSSGVVAFHWSINKRCDDLSTHNVFLVTKSRLDAERSWRVLREDVRDIAPFNEQAPFNFYVHRATATDVTAAPKGCDSIMVLVPCRTLLRDKDLAALPREQAISKYKEQFDDDVVSTMKNAVLDRLGALGGLLDLREHIVDEVVDTPGSYAELYNLAAGTPFALSHGFGQLSLTRPGPQSGPSENILFVGASSRPGNGVPLVLLGAKAVAKRATHFLSYIDKQQ